MQLLQHFKELTIRPKNAKELKGLILQLAIQGKLTANWRAENTDIDPASELLDRIQKEKEQLIKDKKIKNEKPLSPIAEEDIPYELPESWAWCRLNDVCEYIQRGKSPKYTETPKIPVISQKCVQWSGFDITRARFITEESLVKYVEARFLQKGDLLWNSTGDGTIGRVISYPGSNFEKVVADSHVTVVRGFKRYIITEYLWIFTASPLIQNLVAGRVSGSTKQTELGTGTVKSMEFSVPPLEEQKEIVNVVETLFKEVEQLEKLTVKRIGLKEDFITSALRQLTTNNANQEWTFLQDHFKSFFNETTNIKKLRETVLQLAVQGKLTADWRSRNPELVSGTHHASQLLKHIQEEKAQLIADKKIKKEKVLPPITEDEIPYELPDGWVWCRWVDLLDSVKYPMKRGPFGSALRKADFVENGVRVFEQYNPINNDPNWMRYFITREKYQTMKAFNTEAGDFLISCSGATLGRIVYLPKGTMPGIINQALLKLTLSKDVILSDYFLKLFRSYYIQEKIWQKAKGMAIPNMVGVKDLKMIMIPLPPLEEQKAIVQKVNALMGLCDRLEQEVQQSQKYSEQLMQSVLKEVFEPNNVNQL